MKIEQIDTFLVDAWLVVRCRRTQASGAFVRVKVPQNKAIGRAHYQGVSAGDRIIVEVHVVVGPAA